MLKMSDGFTNVFSSIRVIFGFALAFYCLSVSLRGIPLSLAYGIWAGVGTALTVLIGILLWGDPFSVLTLAGLVLTIGGVVLLNSPTSPEKVMKPLS
ncbi:multidrug transporter [Paenibacillus macquariensis subsp. defensor]|nr:multidrug transporter [Paenibacillus macquariensis subsp. defensor]